MELPKSGKVVTLTANTAKDLSDATGPIRHAGRFSVAHLARPSSTGSSARPAGVSA